MGGYVTHANQSAQMLQHRELHGLWTLLLFTTFPITHYPDLLPLMRLICALLALLIGLYQRRWINQFLAKCYQCFLLFRDFCLLPGYPISLCFALVFFCGLFTHVIGLLSLIKNLYKVFLYGAFFIEFIYTLLTLQYLPKKTICTTKMSHTESFTCFWQVLLSSPRCLYLCFQGTSQLSDALRAISQWLNYQ